MKGFVGDIRAAALKNNNFRKVLYTGRHAQLVVQSLKEGEDIGEEVHEKTDQIIHFEQGNGTAILDGVEREVKEGSVILVPAGMRHNVLNSYDKAMRLYTLYAPPHHRDGTIHATKAEAEADKENDHFDGHTTE